eukprot:scaffold4957_cov97-Isochrysis_galbana.AAC.2
MAVPNGHCRPAAPVPLPPTPLHPVPRRLARAHNAGPRADAPCPCPARRPPSPAPSRPAPSHPPASAGSSAEIRPEPAAFSLAPSFSCPLPGSQPPNPYL